jgi:uncharacterized protein YkwD
MCATLIFFLSSKCASLFKKSALGTMCSCFIFDTIQADTMKGMTDMRKLIGKILTLLLAVIFGFWLATSNVLAGTRLGDWMDTLMDFLPGTTGEWSGLEMDLPSLPDSLSNLDIELPESFSRGNNDSDTQETTRVESNAEESEVDYAIVEEVIIELLNELRVEQGLSSLTPNEELKEAATIRAIETEEQFSHTRPDGTDAFTVFDEDTVNYNYRLVGENLGMATYYLEEAEMAELLFNGWSESEGHYENMIRPEYEEIGIGVHYDGENLYATQIFGTPM